MQRVPEKTLCIQELTKGRAATRISVLKRELETDAGNTSWDAWLPSSSNGDPVRTIAVHT